MTSQAEIQELGNGVLLLANIFHKLDDGAMGDDEAISIIDDYLGEKSVDELSIMVQMMGAQLALFMADMAELLEISPEDFFKNHYLAKQNVFPTNETDN